MNVLINKRDDIFKAYLEAGYYSEGELYNLYLKIKYARRDEIDKFRTQEIELMPDGAEEKSCSMCYKVIGWELPNGDTHYIKNGCHCGEDYR